MSDYSSLKATINANIKANNNHEITGAITNSVLNAMVDSLGAGYQFMGVATPTNPGTAQTPDYKCFYLATTPGTYTNLGGLVVAEGEVAILKYDTAWTKEVTGVATADQVSQLGQYEENPDWIYIVTDKEGRILCGIKIDGTVEWSIGVPTPIQNYIETNITPVINAKVDKISGKSLIDSEVANAQSITDDETYIHAITDSEERILEGIKNEGTKEFLIPVDIVGNIFKNEEDSEYMMCVVDSKGRVLVGIKKDASVEWQKGVPTPVKEYADNMVAASYYANKLYPLVDGTFSERLTRQEFINAYNAKLPAFCELCRCNLPSMYELKDADTDEMIFWKINHNFREDVVFDWMDKRLFMSQINKYFKSPIYRFCDAKVNDTNKVDFSLRVLFNKDAVSRVNVSGYTDYSFQCIKTGTQTTPVTINGDEITVNNGWMAIEYNAVYPLFVPGGTYSSGYTFMYEPSSLISDDGQKIELFGQTAYTESEDGVNWTPAVGLSFPVEHQGHTHSSVNKVDGVYMMVGASSNDAATPGNPLYFDLFTSTDKIHWEWRGHLLSSNDDIGSGDSFIIFGNSYLFKDNGGTYYLYYEGARVSPYWETCLMTCTDLFYDRGGGFIGNWEQCAENPIFPYLANDPYSSKTRVFCNPEFVKGQDNQPLKLNGKYYMYYLTGYVDDNGVVQDTLNRMYSYDLVHWTEEGAMFDNRDIADGGERKGDNGDQSMCEFKGRTYLFYTDNMNSYGYSEANIRYTIDDRPMLELLKIKP